MHSAVLLMLTACVPYETAPVNSDSAPPDGPLRVVFIADPHVIGPQYTCCSESDGADNASIMQTSDRLARARDRINAIEPPADLVFVLGDVLHDAHRSHDPDWYDSEDNALPIAADLLGGFDAPVHILWGNHDYEVNCSGETFEREFSHALFARFFGADPYGVVDAGGWRFVMLNSQLGPTWDVDSEQCSTSLGSFGVEQLAWLVKRVRICVEPWRACCALWKLLVSRRLRMKSNENAWT